MAPPLKIPADFTGVVITTRTRIDATTVPGIQAQVARSILPKAPGHRIMHCRQIEHIDSAAIAAVMGLLQAAQKVGGEFVICDPPPVALRLMEIYRTEAFFRERIVHSDERGQYRSGLVPFIPPFVPSPNGRYDVFTRGVHRSYEYGQHDLVEVAPCDYSKAVYAPPVWTAQQAYGVRGPVAVAAPAGAALGALGAARSKGTAMLAAPATKGLVQTRRFAFPAAQTQPRLAALQRLQEWYRKNGLEFTRADIWQSENTPGLLVEALTFADRAQYDRFKARLANNDSWQVFVDLLGDGDTEVHKLF